MHAGLGTWDKKINKTWSLPSRVPRCWKKGGEKKIEVGPRSHEVHSTVKRNLQYSEIKILKGVERGCRERT